MVWPWRLQKNRWSSKTFATVETMTEAPLKSKWFDIQDIDNTPPNLFSLPIEFLKTRAEEFLKDECVQQMVNNFVQQSKMERKIISNGFDPSMVPLTDTLSNGKPNGKRNLEEPNKRIWENVSSTMISVPKRRRLKTPDFFLSAGGQSKLKIVASKVFLIEIMKGHLLFDYATENLTQRHSPYGKAGGDRVKGIAVADFVEDIKFDANGIPSITFQWQMRRHFDIVEDLEPLVPNADYAYTVLRYCLPHTQALEELKDLSTTQYILKMDMVGDARFQFCISCGFELPFAVSKELLQGDEKKTDSELFYCAYCSFRFNPGMYLLPRVSIDYMKVLLRLLKEYRESHHTSSGCCQRDWELKCLSVKRPRKEKFTHGSFLEPGHMSRKATEEIQKYRSYYQGNMPAAMTRIPLLKMGDSVLRKILGAMREMYSPFNERIRHENVWSESHGGLTVYSDQVQSKSMKLKYPECSAVSLLLPITDGEPCEGSAYWLFIPPILLDQVVDWMTGQGWINHPPSLQQLNELSGKFRDTILFQQHSEEVIQIPVGWAYITLHTKPSMQLSFDWIEQNSLHLCVASYINCWHHLTSGVFQKEHSRMEFMSVAMSTLFRFK